MRLRDFERAARRHEDVVFVAPCGGCYWIDCGPLLSRMIVCAQVRHVYRARQWPMRWTPRDEARHQITWNRQGV